MKFLFLGDPHFDSQTPVSRIDDYRKASLKKLVDILTIAVEHKVLHVITTGDFFDKYEVSFSYLNEIVQVLKEFKEQGIKVWSLIGNHDLPYNSMSYFKNTPLSLLFKSGLVEHISEYNKIENVILYGIDFTNHDAIKKFKPDTSLINILIMHYATENTIPGESISLDLLKPFDFTVAGHDHMYYKPIVLEKGQQVLRPGSLLRRTKDEYNLTRDIVLYLFDTENKQVKELKLPNIKPASEIFKNEVFIEKSLNLYDNVYNDLFNKDYFESEANNIVDILKVLPATVLKESKEAIIKYLKETGFPVV
jgi:DNA repair exonuclease SbcCD nuclease subunit